MRTAIVFYNRRNPRQVKVKLGKTEKPGQRHGVCSSEFEDLFQLQLLKIVARFHLRFEEHIQ